MGKNRTIVKFLRLAFACLVTASMLGLMLGGLLQTAQASTSISTTFYTTADGYAWSGGGASSTSEKLRVGFRTAAGNYRTLIKFDLFSIPANATITNAELMLYYKYFSGTAGDLLNISVYRTTENWNEGGLSWSKAQKYDSLSYDSITIYIGEGAGYKAWDITTLVQKWVDGTYANYGVLLRAPTLSGSSNYRGFHSKEFGANIPKLRVTYTTKVSQPPTEAPTHISPSNGAPDVSPTPTFIWSSVANADYYALYISEPPYGEANLVFDSEEDYGPIYGTSFPLPSGILREGVTYHWNMSAWNEAGRGPFSLPWSFTTSTTLLLPPNLSSPDNGALNVSTTPTFSWSSVSGANRYWIMVTTSQSALPTDPYATSAPGCIVSDYTSATSYQPPTPLAEGVTYYWQVQAYNTTTSPITQGEYSSQWSFTILADDVYWLAKAIMSEASVGTQEEQIAVGWTVLNRFHSGNYGSSIEQVVKGGYVYNQEPTSAIRTLADDLLQGKLSDPTDGATYFFSPVSMPWGGEEGQYIPRLNAHFDNFDTGGGLHEVPVTSQKVYFPSWAKPKEGWSVADFYQTIENLEWVSGLTNVRNWYFMFYRPSSEHVTKVLQVPYIHQTYDSPDDFVGSWACAPASAVMVLAYYDKIQSNPITVSYPSPHTSNYGAYISREYTSGDYTFSIDHTEPNVCGTAAAIGNGAWGYIWQDGVNNVKNNLVIYFGIHDIEASFVEQPTQTQAKNLVQQEIDAGRPLIARTYLTDSGHYVVIVGYEVDTQGHFWYKAHDPFGDKPYGDVCWGDYGIQQPVTYSYSQMQLGTASRGLMTTQLKLNQKPNQPASLTQFKSDGVTAIGEGGSTSESTVVFKGTISDLDGDNVKLEIELRETGEAFSGTATPETVSELVSSGSQVTITRYGLVSGSYHWQARSVDEHGLASAWLEFGAVGNTDFNIISRDLDLAKHWAPVWYQDTDSNNYRADYITNFNFDDDWRATNNWESLEAGKLKAYVYYWVVETETHWFIGYADFHPRDWADEPDFGLNSHENDMEGCLLVIRKEHGSTYGTFERMVTQAHGRFRSYTAGDVTWYLHHLCVYVEAKGHGIYGKKSHAYQVPIGDKWVPLPWPWPSWKEDELFPGPHDIIPEGDGIIYYPYYDVENLAQEPQDYHNASHELISYELKLIDELWERKNDSQMFSKFGQFASSVGWGNANPPWGWDDTRDGEQYIAPYFFLFPAYLSDTPSSEYLYRSYQSLPSVGAGAPNPQLFIDCYNRIGGAATLGYPINEVHRWGNGYIQDFRGGEGYGGAIMQPDGASSAYAVYGSIWSRYLTLGGAEGPLGYPLIDETEGKTSSITSARCRYNIFDGGAIVHRKATDGYESKTVFLGWGLFNKWEYLNHGQGVLGLPTSDEREASQSGVDGFDTTGVVCDFEGGHIYWHRTGTLANQAFETHGAIDGVYAQMGGSDSWLGFPVTDEYTNPSYYPQTDFEGGYITTTDGINYETFRYDTTPPTVSSISIKPNAVTLGDIFTISYTVSDTGGSGLNRVELWRKSETVDWHEVTRTSLAGVGNGPYSGSFTDAPPSAETYWYGIHVVDNTGNWAPEDSPISVSVTVPNTAAGNNVTVSLPDEGVDVTFSQVTVPGQTTVTSSDTGPTVPSGFLLAGQYYDITTTADCNGPITMCIHYNPASISGPESSLRLFHYDGATWQDVTTFLDTGNNVIWGEVSSLSVFTVLESLDLTPPAVDNPSPADGSYISNLQPQITITLSDEGTGVDPASIIISVNGVNYSIGAPELNYEGTILTFNPPAAYLDGQVINLVLDAADNAGNSMATYSWSFTIDMMPPDAPVVTGTSPTNDTTPTWNWNIPEDTVDIRYQLDSELGEWTYVDGITVTEFTLETALLEGIHTLYVQASDSAGNWSASGSYAITIDVTPPTATLSNLPASPTNSTTIDVNVAGTDVVAYKYKLDSGSWSSETSIATHITESGLVEGTPILYVVGRDTAGNWQSESEATSYTWTIDLTAPVITITAPVDGAWYKTVNVPAAAFSATDNLDPSPSVGQNGWSNAQGPHTMTVTATDAAGNTATASVHYTVDNTPPTISGAATTSPNANNWYNTDVVVHFTASDEAGGSGLASVTPDVTLTSEGAGQSVTGTATDLAGNSASFTVTGINIDKTPPTVTATPDRTANANGWYNDDVTVTFAADDALSGVDPSSITAPITLSTEAANQSATGYATDLAGNTGSAISMGIKIDKTPPTITGSRNPLANTNGWNNADVTVSFSAIDELSGIANVTGPTTLTQEGTNQAVTGTALDNAGNSTSTTIGDINIDKTKPSITINSPQPKDYLTSESLTIDFSVYDETSGIASMVATLDGSLVSNGQVLNLANMAGSHILEIAASDIAENSNSATVTFQVIIAATVKVDPDTINLQSEGKWITVYIAMPAGYDVTDIDGATVMLNGSIPAHLGKEGWAKAEATDGNIMDHNGDGLLERMVKFERSLVQALLSPSAEVEVTVTGEANGLAFKGIDIIRVIDKGKGGINSGKGKK